MKQNIPCEMIQDLLPLYVDGLTSDESSRQIEAHLETCGDCRSRYQRMKEDLERETQVKQKENEREIDYLKKIRKSSIRKVFLGIFSAFAVILLALFLKLFVIGYPVDSYLVTYANVNGNMLSVGGILYDSSPVYRRYKLIGEEDGNTKLVIYGCLPSVWNRNGAFNLDIDLTEVGTDVTINGMTVKQDGTIVSRQANELFAAKHPYVGDMSANGRAAQLLGIGNTLGSFKNELQTSAEPYGWTLKFENNAANSAVFDEQMKGYACVLMALTGNLGEVTWTYTVELEEGPAVRQRTMTREECSEWAGEPVETFAESPEAVQRLLDLIGEKMK